MAEVDLAEVVREAERLGASQAEAFASSCRSASIDIEGLEVKIGEYDEDSGVGVRVAVRLGDGLALGFGYAASLGKDAVRRAIESAIRAARAKGPDPNFGGFHDRRPKGGPRAPFDRRVAELPVDALAELARELLKIAKSDRRIAAVRASADASSWTVAVANSMGVEGEYETTEFSCGMWAVAKEAGASGSAADHFASPSYSPDSALEMARAVVSMAVEQLGAKPIKPTKAPVVFRPTPYSLPELLSYTLIQQLRADSVQRGRSPLANRLGERVGSELVTIIDDGAVEGALGTAPFDDEGFPTSRTALIEGGVLRGFLHNHYTACVDGVESTGNAYRPDYSFEPSIGVTNFVVEPGDWREEEMVEDMREGLLVAGLLGAHTANEQTGEFSVGTFAAFKVERGELAYPIKEAMIAGNVLELLAKVDAVGREPRQVSCNGGAAIIPAIRVSELAISG